MSGKARRGAVEILRPRQKAPRPQDDTTRGARGLEKRARGARELGDLISIGPAMLRDFELLGIRSVAQLAKQDAQKLYDKLGRVARQHQDICVLDTFCAAVAQARNSRLAAEQCEWWWWSKKRKQRSKEVKKQRLREKR